MEQRQEVYRKVAIERLSSPERLDQLIAVTSASSWLGLLALSILLLGGMSWAAFGTVPETVEGQGVIIRRGAIHEVTAGREGSVLRVVVGVGDEVQVGSRVAVMRFPNLEQRIQTRTGELSQAESTAMRVRREVAEERESFESEARYERAVARRRGERLETQVALLEEKVALERRRAKSGAEDHLAVIRTREQLVSQRGALEEARLELERLDAERSRREVSWTARLEHHRLLVDELAGELESLREQRASSRWIRSPVKGQVVDVLVAAGDGVVSGMPVTLVETSGGERTAVLFVPPRAAARVRSGMTALLRPEGVAPERYGKLLARVSGIERDPTDIERLVYHPPLAEQLAEWGPVGRIDLALETDPSTPSGLQWSSSSGPDQRLEDPTPVTGSIVVDRHRPLRLLLPGRGEE